tara:strand:+ start:41966 stop:42604 length:639 start_codon:yes stop_codon:yes gene_type:complete
MAKWKLILNNKYVVSTNGRVQKKGDYSTTLGRPKRNDVPQFFNIAGQLSVTIEHRIVTMSVARLVAHAFVDGFDMFNTNHELRLIDTSKRPKLKNIMAHVPQDIPQLEDGTLFDTLDGLGMTSTEWNAAIRKETKTVITFYPCFNVTRIKELDEGVVSVETIESWGVSYDTPDEAMEAGQKHNEEYPDGEQITFYLHFEFSGEVDSRYISRD